MGFRHNARLLKKETSIRIFSEKIQAVYQPELKNEA